VGLEAIEALETATSDNDPEVAAQAKYLLRLMRVASGRWKADPAEVKKCLSNYENMDARSREARMRMLAALPDAKGVAALCRLVRFEKSSQLSKTAATALLLRGKAIDPPCPAAIEIIHKSLQGCKRPGAVLALGLGAAGRRSKAAMAGGVNSSTPSWPCCGRRRRRPAPRLPPNLIRFQVAWLKKLGKNDEAIAAIRHWSTWSPAIRSRWPELARVADRPEGVEGCGRPDRAVCAPFCRRAGLASTRWPRRAPSAREKTCGGDGPASVAPPPRQAGRAIGPSLRGGAATPRSRPVRLGAARIRARD